MLFRYGIGRTRSVNLLNYVDGIVCILVPSSLYRSSQLSGERHVEVKCQPGWSSDKGLKGEEFGNDVGSQACLRSYT